MTPTDTHGGGRGRVGFGAMDLSEPDVSDAEAERVLRRAVELGAELIDTADRYGHGHNEALIGRVLARRRDEIRIGTKIGFVGRPGDAQPVDNRPEHLRAACEASLRRLGMDHVDLLSLHRVDPTIALAESVGTLDELRREGKTRAIGLSEVGPVTLRAASRVAPIAAVQVEYSLVSREPGEQLLVTARELGTELHASSPLGIGLLTRTPAELTADESALHRRLRTTPRVDSGARRHNAGLIERLRTLADDLGCTPAQLALAWLVHRDPAVLALPGTRQVDHLEANLAAGRLTLPTEVLAMLGRMFAPGAAMGARKSGPALALSLP